jgi:type I restriction enzyme S subunit
MPIISKGKWEQILIPLPPLAEQQRIVEKLEQILPLVDEYGKNEEKLSQLNKTLPEKLKQSILQHAVQGKLVPQNPTDEPASELLKRIKAEKEQLIKDGKIKKEKTLPPITQDEIPYELPQGWEWVRLGNLSFINRGITPKYDNNSIYKFINQKCVRWGNIELKYCKSVTEESFKKFDRNKLLQTNDLLINSTGEGTIGRCSAITSECNGLAFDSHVLAISPIYCFNSYIEYFINSALGQNQINEAKGAKTTKQTELGVEKTRFIIIPLPPLVEQQRIVAKVDELLSIVEKIKG